MATSEFSSRETLSAKQACLAERVFWLLCVYPLIWLSQFCALGIYVWLRFGYWPNTNTPDSMSMDVLVKLQMMGVIFGIPLLGSWPFVCSAWAVVLIRSHLFRFRRHAWGLLLAIVSGALAYWQVEADPTGLWRWSGLSNWFWD